MVIPDTKVMYNKTKNSIVFDLYEVGSPREGGTSLPFVHRVELAGPKGEVVRFRSVFDDGALVNAIDETPSHRDTTLLCTVRFKEQLQCSVQ